MEQYINKIICSDCLDILKQLPDKCVDLVLTDPPYIVECHGGTNSALAKRTAKVRDSIEFMANDFDFVGISTELLRISTNIVMFCSNAQISRTMSFFETNGLRTTLCVWDKTNPAPLGFNKMVNNLEYIVIARGKGAYYNNDLPIEKKFMSFRYPTPANKKHPATKPLELFSDLINLFSKENDLVLDCFSGSGTTAVACHNLKRRFICIEKDPEYWKASCERLEQAQRQQMLF
ncbi:MAG: site-specific DNA-methyltransferase [Clostridia bacterium]|nr:site-specific DNA-methyltransferase [Clostridia bacterium]MBO7715078.1 site-specific DNA-methyltransferase [Methanobrevibacter sp.]